MHTSINLKKTNKKIPLWGTELHVVITAIITTLTKTYSNLI